MSSVFSSSLFDLLVLLFSHWDLIHLTNDSISSSKTWFISTLNADTCHCWADVLHFTLGRRHFTHRTEHILTHYFSLYRQCFTHSTEHIQFRLYLRQTTFYTFTLLQTDGILHFTSNRSHLHFTSDRCHLYFTSDTHVILLLYTIFYTLPHTYDIYSLPQTDDIKHITSDRRQLTLYLRQATFYTWPQKNILHFTSNGWHIYTLPHTVDILSYCRQTY